jgi:hypothetical protein
MNLEVTRSELSIIINALDVYAQRLSDEVVWTGDPESEEDLDDIRILDGKIEDLLMTNDDNPASHRC